MFQAKVIEKIKAHILCSATFLRKSCRLWDNEKTYCRGGRAIDGNIIRSMRVARTRLSFTLLIHLVSCNRDTDCLLRGTNLVLLVFRLRFVLRGLPYCVVFVAELFSITSGFSVSLISWELQMGIIYVIEVLICGFIVVTRLSQIVLYSTSFEGGL
jgi:hypothetical protein